MDPAESKASTTGAAIRPLSAAEWPPAPRRSGPLSAGDGSMLLRLSDSDICETQIMSRVRAYAMGTGEKLPAIGRFHRRGQAPPRTGPRGAWGPEQEPSPTKKRPPPVATPPPPPL